MNVHIACLQMASHPFDWDYNIEKATSMIKSAAGEGANICLLPEVFIPGYSHDYNNFHQAETIDGPTISLLKGLARDLNIYISGSIVEKAERNFFNTMVVIGPDGLLGSYRKIHVFSLEQKYWKPGKDVHIVETEYGAIGLGICADMHYPKLWKQYAGKVDFLLICSAWPETGSNYTYARHELALCKNLPVQISKVLQVPTAYCNACHPVGNLPLGLGTICCAGFSKIVNNNNIIASADSNEEKIIHGTIEITGARPEVEDAAFKNWIKYHFREQIPKFLVEKFSLLYAKAYYRWHKRKFSD
ncbi:MAG: carbon-nitrogen hydrolase family protein [Candidatus Helarchaeota archaeon]